MTPTFGDGNPWKGDTEGDLLASGWAGVDVITSHHSKASVATSLGALMSCCEVGCGVRNMELDRLALECGAFSNVCKVGRVGVPIMTLSNCLPCLTKRDLNLSL